MDKSKIANLDPKEYTHLPHAEQDFEAHEQTDVAIRPLIATLVALAVIIIVSAVGMWGLFKVLEANAKTFPENQQLSAVKPKVRQVPDGMPNVQGVQPQKGADRSPEEFAKSLIEHPEQDLPAQEMEKTREHNALVLAGKAPMRPGLQPGKPIDEAMREALDQHDKYFKTAPAGRHGEAAEPTTKSAAAESEEGK